MTGGLEFEAVLIDPSVVDPDDVELLRTSCWPPSATPSSRPTQVQAAAMGGVGLGGGLAASSAVV